MTSNSSVPILLASDFPIFRDSLKTVFEQVPNIQVVGCASGDQVVPCLQSLQPKLVVLDLEIEWEALCSLLDQIHASSRVRSIIMSDVLDSSRVIEVLRHGAHGLVPRRTTLELLKKSVQTVLEGGFWVSRGTVADLIQSVRESAPNKRHPKTENIEIPASSVTASVSSSAASEAEIARLGLTRREVQVIGALADGQTNKDIAATFNISEYTVKHHLTNIYDKLGVYNRVELVLFTINRGLCTSPTLVSAMADTR